ncbi:MAG TPA: hypothetical protein VEJ67_00980 [Candidatus Cybelea sp.]|nr:hypothetical protein [Candidatus Cybelea sp.]
MQSVSSESKAHPLPAALPQVKSDCQKSASQIAPLVPYRRFLVDLLFAHGQVELEFAFKIAVELPAVDKRFALGAGNPLLKQGVR